MFWLIEFLKNDTLNGVSYKKGDVIRVSESIKDDKVGSGLAKEVKEEAKVKGK